MKSLTNFTFLFFLLFINSKSFSQSQVALEQIQVYSTLHPSSKYWYLPEDISPLEKALDTGIFKEFNLERVKTFSTSRKILNKQNQVGKIIINWDSTRSIPYHAYLELYELDPETSYENKLVNIRESKKDSIQSIWALAVTIFNQQHERIFQKTILLGILPIQSLGIGYPSNWLATTPNSLYQAINKGIQFLSRDIPNMEFIEANVPLAFATDNYWMPIINNQPRILFDTSNHFISYATKSGLQLLRIPNASLSKIDFKIKNQNYPYIDIINTIRKSRSNVNSNEYYHVVQPLRDVYANKDYSLNGFIEFNPNFNNSIESPHTSALQFLTEIPNIIYDGKDSIGYFTVNEMIVEKEKFYFPEKVYNGYDSTKQFPINDKINSIAIVHNTVIMGKVYGQDFAIQFDYGQQLKTILIDNKIVMVVEGSKKPRQMVSLSKTNTSNINNLLLMMAYGELFQSPN